MIIITFIICIRPCYKLYFECVIFLFHVQILCAYNPYCPSFSFHTQQQRALYFIVSGGKFVDKTDFTKAVIKSSLEIKQSSRKFRSP